jgi:MFS family permease
MENQKSKWWMKPLIYFIFVFIVAVTAKVDWAAEHSASGFLFRYFWLLFLLGLGFIFPIVFMYLAGNKERKQEESDKKWFIISLILFMIANGIPIIFYVVLGISPGFFLFVQLALFGLVPAFIFQPKNIKRRYIILIVLAAALLIPLIILVDVAIGDIWAHPYNNTSIGILGELFPDLKIDKTFYYLLFWGLFCVFLYFIIAIGWKFGGGTKRGSWNIFFAGMLIQYSTLEDFLYYILNGQPLPGTWPWLESFVINLVALFGHIPTDLDLLVFALIINLIALFILFDCHGYIYQKITKKTTEKP